MRREVKSIFDSLDKNRDGGLSKVEFSVFMKKAKKQMQLMQPPFDLDNDWKLMCSTPDDPSAQVSFAEFEAWWKARNGIEDPDIPVLPEFMAKKINEFALSPAALKGLAGKVSAAEAQDSRTGQKLWDFLRPRLKLLVAMQAQWGDLRDLYDSRNYSFFGEIPLPKCIRDPESSFSAAWDLLQIICLVYVAFTIPYRQSRRPLGFCPFFCCAHTPKVYTSFCCACGAEARAR